MCEEVQSWISSTKPLGDNPYENWARGYKTFFMLNSAEHEISNSHNYGNIKKCSIFQAQKSLEC